MKTSTLPFFKALSAALILSLASLVDAGAANMFWDPNGTGTAGNGTWDATSTKWATSSTLTASTVSYVNGSFPEFAAGTGGINAIAITVSGSPTCVGMATGLAGATVTNLTFSGSGSIGILTNGATSLNGGWVQGFFCGPSSAGGLTFNVSLTGGGGIQQSSSGFLALYTNNTYSGGTSLTGGQLVYFNNNNSFGTGGIYVGGSAGALVNSATSLITIPNNITFQSTSTNYNLNLAASTTVGTIYNGTVALPAAGTVTLYTGGSPNGQIVILNGVISGSSGLTVADNGIMELGAANTFSGALTITSPARVVITNAGSLGNGSYAKNITNNSVFIYNSSASQTLSGVLSGSGSLTQKGSGTLTLSGANTYSGGTTNAGGTLSVNTIADSGTSALGTSGAFYFAGGTLKYTGSGAATTGRAVKGLPGTASTIDLANGNLTLNAGITTSSSGAFTVDKSGASTLTLSGSADDAYLGMNVNAGTVVLSKTSSSSVHGLGGNSSIASGATLKLGGSGGDQIYPGLTIIDNGTFDMAGKSEGFSVLLGSGLVTNSSTGTSTLTLGENNGGGVFDGVIADGTSGNVALTKAGSGTLILSGANAYSGATTVNAGTLALTNSGSLGNGTSITLAAGTTFDVSGQTSITYTLGSSSSLTAGGSSTSTIIADPSGTIDLGSRPITLNFDGTHTPLTISQGALNLNGNSYTVNNTGSALGVGAYTLVSVTSGTITSSGTPAVSVTGGGLAAGNTASLAISGGTVAMIVKASPAFSSLTSPSVPYGTASVVLTGKIAAGTLYPASGEAVTATINGNTVSGSVTNSTGDFSITYNDASLATNAAGSYTITYAYGGNASLNPAISSATSLTITGSITVTANNQTKTYGQTVTFGAGSTNFTATGLQNGDTIGSVTLAVSGGGNAGTAPVSGSPYTITASAATGGTFNSANYSITYNTGTLTVNPASLGVTADDTSRAYGAPNPAFTVTYANFANSETLGTSDVVGSPAPASVDSTGDVGTYVITNAVGTLASTNYTFALTNGTLTVTNALSTNTVTASVNPALPGTAVVFTSTLSAIAPSTAVPTNLIAFLIDGTNSAGSLYPSSGAASFTNSVLSHGYHTIEADYAGDTNALGATNIVGSSNTVTVLINTPPVASPFTNSRPQNVTLHIAITNLLAGASDADGDALTLLGVDATSTNGATLTTNGAFITYTPPATNGNVTDTFNYIVQDTFGATASNTVTITVQSEANGPSVNITGLATLSNGTMQIGFAGIPNYTYLVEGTTNLTTPITWTVLGTNVAGTNGLFQFTDLDATNHPTRYYRTAVPPGY